jgi:hypothetical protein
MLRTSHRIHQTRHAPSKPITPPQEVRFVAADPGAFKGYKENYDRSRKTVTRTGARPALLAFLFRCYARKDSRRPSRAPGSSQGARGLKLHVQGGAKPDRCRLAAVAFMHGLCRALLNHECYT